MIKTDRDLAIELVIDYFESNNIAELTSNIEERVDKYLSYFEVIDPSTLAALAIFDTPNFDFSTSEIRKIKESYF